MLPQINGSGSDGAGVVGLRVAAVGLGVVGKGVGLPQLVITCIVDPAVAETV